MLIFRGVKGLFGVIFYFLGFSRVIFVPTSESHMTKTTQALSEWLEFLIHDIQLALCYQLKYEDLIHFHFQIGEILKDCRGWFGASLPLCFFFVLFQFGALWLLAAALGQCLGHPVTGNLGGTMSAWRMTPRSLRGDMPIYLQNFVGLFVWVGLSPRCWLLGFKWMKYTFPDAQWDWYIHLLLAILPTFDNFYGKCRQIYHTLSILGKVRCFHEKFIDDIHIASHYGEVQKAGLGWFEKIQPAELSGLTGPCVVLFLLVGWFVLHEISTNFSVIFVFFGDD